MYSAYTLNNQGDDIQPWHTPFPIWNQSVVPCPVLTVASWPAYRFLRGQLRWSGILICLRIFHSLLWSTQPKALVYSIKQKWMFFWNSLFLWSNECWQFNLWFLCIFYIQLVHLEVHGSHTIEAQLEGFEHCFASMWNDHNNVVVWTFFDITFL